jgi:hypothetical protein
LRNEEKNLATYTPPPYFPQGSLSPPDERRYRKFKMILLLGALALILLLAGSGIAIWYLANWLF